MKQAIQHGAQIKEFLKRFKDPDCHAGSSPFWSRPSISEK